VHVVVPTATRRKGGKEETNTYRLDVPVDDGFLVQSVDPHQKLVGNLQHRLQRKTFSTPFKQVLQRRPHQFHHHDVVHVQVVAEKVHRADAFRPFQLTVHLVLVPKLRTHVPFALELGRHLSHHGER